MLVRVRGGRGPRRADGRYRRGLGHRFARLQAHGRSPRDESLAMALAGAAMAVGGAE